MDIIAKAKPVRFRIVSGGVECTSLDDLRAHFDLRSVADTINDGRLEKWLNYIKEFEFAKQVREIGKFDSSNMEMSLRVLSLFTGKEYNREVFKSDSEYIEFLDKDKNTSQFALKLIKESMHKDVDVLLYAYHNHSELIKDACTCFAPFLKTGNPELMFWYGMEMITSSAAENNKDMEAEGLSYIEKAAKKGDEEAKEFMLILKRKKIDDSKYEKSRKEVTAKIRDIMGGYSGYWREHANTASADFTRLALSPRYPQEVKDIFKLLSVFCELAKIPQMWMVRDTLERHKTEKFGTAQKIFDFIYLYVKEDTLSISDTISSYKALNYPPATTRAQEFQKGKRGYQLGLETEQGIYIKMSENPDYSQFIHFLYYFMTNIMYL